MKQLKEVNQARPEAPARTHIKVHLRGNIRLVPIPDIVCTSSPTASTWWRAPLPRST